MATYRQSRNTALFVPPSPRRPNSPSRNAPATRLLFTNPHPPPGPRTEKYSRHQDPQKIRRVSSDSTACPHVAELQTLMRGSPQEPSFHPDTGPPAMAHYPQGVFGLGGAPLLEWWIHQIRWVLWVPAFIRQPAPPARTSDRNTLEAQSPQGVFGFIGLTMKGGADSPGRGISRVPAFIQQPAPPTPTSDRRTLGAQHPQGVFGFDGETHMEGAPPLMRRAARVPSLFCRPDPPPRNKNHRVSSQEPWGVFGLDGQPRRGGPYCYARGLVRARLH